MVVEISINYWAVLAAGAASFVIGMIWYAPGVFGNAWMRAGKFSKESMDEAHKKGMAWRFFTMFLGSLLIAYILAHFVQYTSSATFAMGMTTGFWVWLGFVVPVLIGSVLWENKSFAYYLINVAFHLVSLLVMGGILAAWA